MSVFEKLKEKIQNLFFLKKKDCSVPVKSARPELTEETTLLIDTTERFKPKESRGYLVTNVSNLSLLPPLYLFINVATIVILLIYKLKDNVTFKNDILIGDTKVTNYFNLFKVNHFVFHLYTCANSITGVIFVFLLFSLLKQKFKSPENEKHSFKLHILLILGFLTHLISLGVGFIPYVDNYKQANHIMLNEIKIELSQFLFLTMNFFFILFGIYSLICLNVLRNYKVRNEAKENWFIYKVITLIYLSCFTVIYLLILLFKNKVISFGLSENALAKHQNYVLALFPYFIHILSGLLIFSFYYEFKSVNLTLSETLEGENLDDESNKNVF
jgi:hypothetical protein